ncbi:MAG: rhombosortase [Candidatus Omnitrophica bacterium]|nr:rhombosortase [Candidatus Omnitrophota bacterium]
MDAMNNKIILAKSIPPRSNDRGGMPLLKRHIPWHTIMISVGIILLHYLFMPLNALFIYNRSAIAQNEVWRLLTGHLVHYNFDHLFWNVLAFGIIGTTVELKSLKRFYRALLISFTGVGLWLWLGAYTLPEYSGLSGALNGLFVGAIWMEWKDTKQNYLILILLGAIAKIIFELLTHQTIFMQPSEQCSSVPISHLAGLMSGFVFILFEIGLMKLKSNPSNI